MIVRPPQPPPPPEPVPGSLDEQVDWMTYSHQEMYRMVHDGLDLAGATAVSANWARLGDSLGEIGDELNRIGQAFEHAWQGEAADQASHAVSSLAIWATEAGGLATEVSGCITIQVDNATRARNGMPAPPVAPTLPPHPVSAGNGTLAASAFTGGDFAMAPLLLSDQTAIAREQQAAHRQAAETMEQFQTASREVYHTVPRFSAPKIGTKPPGGEENPPAPAPTTPQHTPAEPAPERAPAVSGPVAGRPSPVATPAPVATPEPVATPAQPVPGADPPRPTAATPAAASAGATARPGGGPMGGMPLGGMGGGRKGEDLERKSPAYVKEDEDLWGLGDQVVAPPVIGEDQGRRA